ncbi:MAG: pyridoxal-phosphate dependent enzyme [Betaproteobacteria bacterium]|nr:pyridoxal-phosphate dependent enzyme [Betaproteobacteria bacterium]
MRGSRLVCSGCGWEPPAGAAYPFRCARSGSDDRDHVLVHRLGADAVLDRGDDDNPFVRYRECLYAWHAARARGMSDAAFVDLVTRINERIAAVDGHGFRVTPFGRIEALSDYLGLNVWVKDETGNVAGSHKARHLMGILLYLAVTERGDGPPLAIASCGNAALAAAVLARAASRALQVFVPPSAEPAVLERLHALGATVVSCPRVPGERGDPCVHRFHEALRAGALAFCCQGNENGLAIDGGETLVYEMLGTGAPPLDDLVVQVGGGALASTCMQAYARAVAAGLTASVPRVHTVQTRGASPLQRAWTLVQERRASTGASAEDALRYAAAHRSSFMWPWEQVPHSIAEGILDDETYDWVVVLQGMTATKGTTVVANEETLKEANRLARETTGIAVSHTGSAGLAGLLQLHRDGVIATGARVGVLFTGVQR